MRQQFVLLACVAFVSVSAYADTEGPKPHKAEEATYVVGISGMT